MMEQKQNATKSRDAQETVRNSNIGKALGDINKTDNVSVETPKISDASFIRKLSRPRSQRYIELLKREMEVSGRLSELYKQLEQKGDKLTAEERQVLETKNIPIAEWFAEDIQPIADSDTLTKEKEWWEEDVQPEHREDIELQQGEKRQEVPSQKKEWWQQDVVLQNKEEAFVDDSVLAEIQALRKELVEIKQALEEELPIGKERLGIIWRSDKRDKLNSIGAFEGVKPGGTFRTVDELLKLADPESEREARQWMKGNDAYHEVNGECLLVEIYLPTVCVIFEDGSVRCYRD